MEEKARSGIINGVMTVAHSWPWQVGAVYSDQVTRCDLECVR